MSDATPAEMMHQFSESMGPIREFANGMRAQLMRDGWSAPVAERIAAEMLSEMIRAGFRQNEGGTP